MNQRRGRLRRAYGGQLWTLPLLLVPFALTAYVIAKLVSDPHHVRIFVWFLAAALLNDVVLFPMYALLDRLLVHFRSSGASSAPRILNHVRIPAGIAFLLLLIYAPTILGRGDRTFRAASGLGPTNDFLRWLLLTLTLFVASALIYICRLLFRIHRNRSTRVRPHPSLPERGTGPALGAVPVAGRIQSDRGGQREHR